MYKKVLFEQEARNKILDGVNIVTRAVASTLGPRGQNVIFEESMFPTITKDGVTVAQQVFLEDKFENMGVMIARQAAEDTNREAGDGTTTTIVLLQKILEEGHKAVAAGMNPILIKKGMDEALKQIIESLDKQTRKIENDEKKLQVAMISANNDKEIGDLIVEVINKVGTDGVVTVTPSNSLKTEVVYVNGTELNSGFESHVFINDRKRLSVAMDNPKIIISTDSISLQSQLIPIIQKLIEAGHKNLILLADKIEGSALAFLVQNFLQGKFTCVPVSLPSFGDYQRDLIYDLAALTGATVLGTQDAKKIEEADIDDCGTVESIIIDRDSTILSGTSPNIQDRIDETKALLEGEKDLFNKEKLKDRLGRLTGSIANIKVGGASSTEQIEMKYRIEDSLNATKAAIEEGVVAGGGMALLECQEYIICNDKDGKEYNMGIEIVNKALSSPLKMIADNSGQIGDAVVGMVQAHKLGYNALTNTYVDLFKAGIIDPKKVVRNEIINAVATAGILLTSNCAIALMETKKDE